MRVQNERLRTRAGRNDLARNHSARSYSVLAIAIGAGLAGAGVIRGQVNPIALTSGSYNYNTIVNGAASTPGFSGGTPTTVDPENPINLYYSNSYGGGVPAGAFSSSANSQTTFALQTDGGNFDVNNTMVINADQAGNTFSPTPAPYSQTGSITLASPGSFSSLALLQTVAGEYDAGYGPPTISYTLNFTDGSTYAGSFAGQTWNTSTSSAAIGVNRIWTSGSNLGEVDSGYYLNEADIIVPTAYLAKQLSSISFTDPGSGQNGVGNYDSTLPNQFMVYGLSGSSTNVLTYTGADTGDSGKWDTVSSSNFNSSNGGPVAYSDGSVVVFDDTAVGSTTLNIPNSVSPLEVFFNNSSKTYSIGGAPIAGTGGVILNGTGTVTLTSSNSYTGPTTLNAGTLILSGAGSIASSTVSIASGSMLSLQSAASSPLSVTPAVTDNGVFRLTASTATVSSLNGSGTLSIDPTSTLTLSSGTLSGLVTINAGGVLNKIGTGSFTAGGGITLNGTVNVQAGTFQLTQTGSTFTGGRINVSSGATLGLTSGGTGQLIASDLNTILSDTTFSSGGVLSLTNSSTTVTPTITANLSNIGLTKLGNGQINLSGTDTISGTLSLSAGTLVLSPATTLSGGLTLNGTALNLNGASGTLVAFNSGSGTTTNRVLTNTSTTLSNLTVAVTTNNTSNIQGDVIGNIALTVGGTGTTELSGTNTYTGTTNISSGILEINSSATVPVAAVPIYFGGGQLLIGNNSSRYDFSSHFSSAANQNFNINSSAGVTFSSGMNSSGGNFTKLGSQTLTLKGTSHYTGYTNVSAGTLTLGASNVLPSTTILSVYNNAVLNMATYNDTVAGLNVSNGKVQGTGTITNNTTPDFFGLGEVDASLGGSGGIIKALTGTMNLTGTNTYSGTVNISGGTLLFSGSKSFSPNTSSVLFSGGTLEYSSGYTADSSAIFSTSAGQAFNLNTNGQTVTLATGLVSSGGSLNKLGTGTLTLGATSSYNGPTTLSAGTLVLGAAIAINPASPLVFAGGNLDLNGGSSTFASLTGTTGAVLNNGGSPGTINIAQPAGTSTYSGSLADGTNTVSAVFNGTGNQVLSGISNYSGGTTITSGKVTAASNTALGTGPVKLNGATLALALQSTPTTVVSGIAAGTAPTQFKYNLGGQNQAFGQQIAGSTTILTTSTDVNGLPIYNEAASVFTNSRIPLGTSFTAKFTYLAVPGTNQEANGLTFTLQNDSRGAAAIGNDDVDLGYGDSINGTNQIQNSAAVAFNLFGNGSPAQTIGESFQSGGTLANSFNSVQPYLPYFLNEFLNVTVSYDAAAQTLSDTIVGSTDGQTYTNTYAGVNLSSIIGGNSAYVGFTASTGAFNSSQQITNFSFATQAAGPSSIVNNVIANPGTTNTIQLGIASGAVAGGIGSLNIGSGAVVTVAAQSLDGIATHGVLTTTGVSLSGTTNGWTSKLDLTNNSLDVANGNLAQLTNQVLEGYANGSWQGSGGITSSTAAADPSHLMALGVILNTVDNINPLYGSAGALGLFSGISPGTTDVLIKLTYYGDANLDGRVDGSDYSLIDSAFSSETPTTPISGWYNGDFNYDGVINGSDYTLIDNAFNTQGTSLAAQTATATATATASIGSGAAVPEPTAMGLFAISALGLLGRRKRQ